MTLLNYILPKVEDYNCCCLPKNPRGCISCCLFTLLGASLFISSIKESKAEDNAIDTSVSYPLQLIDNYQKNISPQLHQKLGTDQICRYTPSCSEYAKQAIQQKGLVLGSVDTASRFLRCNPWSKGGLDEVKPNQTQEHYLIFREISAEKGLRTAIKYDWETTKEDFKKISKGLIKCLV